MHINEVGEAGGDKNDRNYSLSGQRVMRALILLLFAVFLILRTETGQIVFYVHPRFIPLARFTYVVFIILTVVEATKIWKRGRNSDKDDHGLLKPTTAMIFLAPALLGLLLQPATLDSAMAQKKGGASALVRKKQVNSSDRAKQKTRAENKNKDKDKDTVASAANATGILELTDDNFVTLEEKINTEPEKMRGQKVKITGFVIKSADHKKTEFSLVRFAIVCCTADAVPVGLTFEYLKAASLKPDEWYQVTGVIPTGNISKWQDMPVLDLIDIKQVKALPQPYVYPDWSQINGGN
jgi:putative membrane protein